MLEGRLVQQIELLANSCLAVKVCVHSDERSEERRYKFSKVINCAD